MAASAKAATTKGPAVKRQAWKDLAAHHKTIREHRFVRPIGVELGKVLAQRIIPELESKAELELSHHTSTDHLIRYYRKMKETA